MDVLYMSVGEFGQVRQTGYGRGNGAAKSPGRGSKVVSWLDVVLYAVPIRQAPGEAAWIGIYAEGEEVSSVVEARMGMLWLQGVVGGLSDL